MAREWRAADNRTAPLLLGMVEAQGHEVETLRAEVRRLREVERELRARLAVMAIEVSC